MLPEANRLKGEKNFKRILTKARAYHSSLFILRALRNESAASRIGFIISARVSKKATVRNRLRRQLREIVRAELPRIKRGYDIAVTLKPAGKDAPFAALQSGLLFLLSKLRP